MELLEPSKIRAEKKTEELSIQTRIKGLADEEARLVQKVNLARENSDLQIVEINNLTEDFRDVAKKEKKILNQEIVLLEKKRKILLKPVHEIQKIAEAKIADAENYRIQLDKELVSIEVEREQNKVDRNFNKNAKILLNNSELDLKQRGENLTKKENKVKDSSEKQMRDWKKFYNEVAEFNKKIAKVSQKEVHV